MLTGESGCGIMILHFWLTFTWKATAGRALF
jgi:hypothetical protein